MTSSWKRHKWTTLAVFIQLAFQESRQKADRVGASWEMRRQRARKDGSLLGSSLPARIEVTDGEARLIPEKAAAVRRVFQLAADGLGHARIIKQLANEKAPALGKKVVRDGRTRSQFSGVWTKAYISLLLRDPRVVGELQPMTNGKPDGPPLVGYYPAVVSEEEFTLARAALEERTSNDSLRRRVGPKQGKYTNIFKGILTHASDGQGMQIIVPRSRDRRSTLGLCDGVSLLAF